MQQNFLKTYQAKKLPINAGTGPTTSASKLDDSLLAPSKDTSQNIALSQHRQSTGKLLTPLVMGKSSKYQPNHQALVPPNMGELRSESVEALPAVHQNMQAPKSALGH